MTDASKAKKASSKAKTLASIKTYPEDDERTSISKKISWILRQGVPRNYVEHNDGWVKMTDLLKAEILDGVSRETLDKVIVDSNASKLRYQLSSDGQLIKAYSKAERKNITDGASAPEPAEPKVASMRAEATEFVPNAATVSAAAAAASAPQASFPSWPYMGMMGMQYPFGWPGMAGAARSPAGAPAAAAAAGAMGAGRYVGKLKSFNSEKGFGFIECPQVYATYKRDTFVHKAQLGDIKVGTDVLFAIETNKQGFPQAKEITTMAGVPLVAGGAPAGKGKKGGGKDGKGEGKGKGKAKGEGKSKGKGKKGDKEAAEGGDAEAKAEAKVEDKAEGGEKEAAPAEAKSEDASKA